MKKAGVGRVVVVLGMHRSGTSAVAGALARLGVDLGRDLKPAIAGVNERGFWEHRRISEVHERVLARLDSAWDDVCPLPSGWWDRDDVADCRRELEAIVDTEFAGAPLWGFKDPRACRLLPLWQAIFAARGIEPSYVVVVRDPYAVAASLALRDGFPVAQGLLLWAAHMIAVVEGTRGAPRAFLHYDRLLTARGKALAALGRALGIDWPVPAARAARDIDTFLEPQLRHHVAGAGAADAGLIAQLTGRLYRLLPRDAGGDFRPGRAWAAEVARLGEVTAQVCPQLAGIRAERNRVTTLYHAERDAFERSLAEAAAAARALEAERDRLRSELTEAQEYARTMSAVQQRMQADIEAQVADHQRLLDTAVEYSRSLEQANRELVVRYQGERAETVRAIEALNGRVEALAAVNRQVRIDAAAQREQSERAHTAAAEYASTLDAARTEGAATHARERVALAAAHAEAVSYARSLESERTRLAAAHAEAAAYAQSLESERARLAAECARIDAERARIEAEAERLHRLVAALEAELRWFKRPWRRLRRLLGKPPVAEVAATE